jgi:nicotinate-nucleotide adenylyltransferase
MVCLFGGGFDPPHNGHLALVKTALARFEPERLLVLPIGRASYKPLETPSAVRLRLAEAAFADLERVLVSDYEIVQDEPSFTLTSTRWAKQLDGEVLFLIGADQFALFDGWPHHDELLQTARLGVATRPGYREEQLRRQLGQLTDPARVEFFEIPAIPISSTEIRARVASGEDVSGLVPAKVLAIIGELGLYRS